MKWNIKGVALLCAFLCWQCFGMEEKTDPGFLSVKEGRFVDAHGRTVILNGLNHVSKNPEENYLYAGDEELFRRFKNWGFNCIRYGIHWDALEPEPGKINEAYLQEIDKRVKWAEENGLWLVLDMHQDLYGRKFDNGAPDWATLDEGLPHITGETWSAAYMISPAVQKSFDNFWQNAPAPDGVGVQDHYIRLWMTIAGRYANCPSVAGFDVMNEPFMGSCGAVLSALMEGCSEAAAALMARETGKRPTEAELTAEWGEPRQRVKVLTKVDDKELFARMVDKADTAVNAFDGKMLSRFYQRVRDSIRKVNRKQILFLEHSFFANLGIPSRFKVPLDENGQPDPFCAYAPHGYDLVTDSDQAAHQGYERLGVIFSRLWETGKRNQLPVWVGEWGAFYLGENKYVEPARHIVGLIEQNLAGQSYWSYWDHIDTQDYFFGAMVRPYPVYTNGRLAAYRNDLEKRKFGCSWTEEGETAAPTRIFIPDMKRVKSDSVRLTPTSEMKWVTPVGSVAGYIEIAPVAGKSDRTLSFSW